MPENNQDNRRFHNIEEVDFVKMKQMYDFWHTPEGRMQFVINNPEIAQYLPPTDSLWLFFVLNKVYEINLLCKFYDFIILKCNFLECITVINKRYMFLK